MNRSVWEAAKAPKIRSRGAKDDFNVYVVGGGIAGLSAAYFLQRSGFKVCLYERDRIGHGDTRHTTAHLTAMIDLRPAQLVKRFGKARARLVWRAGATAIDVIEAVVREHGISCEFVRTPGYLHAPIDSADNFRDDLRALKAMEVDATAVTSAPIVGRPGIRFANQAKFHPLKFLHGLARAFVAAGGTLVEGAEAPDLSDRKVVIATHVPIQGEKGTAGAALFQTKLALYSSYAIAADIAARSLPESLLWDTNDPYSYLRVDGKRVIYGGRDHKTGQRRDNERIFGALEKELRRLVPGCRPSARWSGQVIETPDGLPYIGEYSDNQFIATGFSGNGMTFGIFSGLMACDWMMGKKSAWEELFSHRRKIKSAGGIWNYLKENVDYPACLLKDMVAPAEAKTARDVKRGEGKVLRGKVACYRDPRGKLHKVSAVCTHMGCVVRWNGSERTWDCPCHGSRFATDGKVIAGPAEDPLGKV